MWKESFVVDSKDGKRTVFIGDDLHNRRGMKLKKRRRERIYDDKIVNALIYLWRMSDYLCGKRLHVYIREILPVLEKFNEIHFDEETKEKLISISPATIDRFLKNEKMKLRLKGRSKLYQELC